MMVSESYVYVKLEVNYEEQDTSKLVGGGIALVFLTVIVCN